MSDEDYKQAARLAVAVSAGFTIGMIASWQSATALCTRIGQGAVMVAMLVSALYVAEYLLEKVLRTFGVYRDFPAVRVGKNAH